MSEKPELSDDQEKRIDATLRRIRGGLRRDKNSQQTNPFEEPAHSFSPEAFHADEK